VDTRHAFAKTVTIRPDHGRNVETSDSATALCQDQPSGLILATPLAKFWQCKFDRVEISQKNGRDLDEP